MILIVPFSRSARPISRYVLAMTVALFLVCNARAATAQSVPDEASSRTNNSEKREAAPLCTATEGDQFFRVSLVPARCTRDPNKGNRWVPWSDNLKGLVAQCHCDIRSRPADGASCPSGLNPSCKTQKGRGMRIKDLAPYLTKLVPLRAIGFERRDECESGLQKALDEVGCNGDTLVQPVQSVMAMRDTKACPQPRDHRGICIKPTPRLVCVPDSTKTNVSICCATNHPNGIPSKEDPCVSLAGAS